MTRDESYLNDSDGKCGRSIQVTLHFPFFPDSSICGVRPPQASYISTEQQLLSFTKGKNTSPLDRTHVKHFAVFLNYILRAPMENLRTTIGKKTEEIESEIDTLQFYFAQNLDDILLLTEFS